MPVTTNLTIEQVREREEQTLERRDGGDDDSEEYQIGRRC
jgi:hypothetical protein